MLRWMCEVRVYEWWIANELRKKLDRSGIRYGGQERDGQQRHGDGCVKRMAAV